MIKKILLLAALFLSSPVYSQNVIDDARLFTDIQIRMLNERIRIIKMKSDISIVVLTTRSVKTALSIQKKKNHVIIVSSMSERKIYIVSDEKILTERESLEIITDHMKYPYRSRRYFDGISNAINYIEIKKCENEL